MNYVATLKDPTHVREFLLNLKLTASDGYNILFELQVGHKGLWDIRHTMGGHSDYEFFRAIFKSQYASTLDNMLERAFTFLSGEVAKTPVLLSMLIAGLSDYEESGMVALPYCLYDLYCFAITRVVSRQAKHNTVLRGVSPHLVATVLRKIGYVRDACLALVFLDISLCIFTAV
jgi:hypothetical protein